LPLFEPANARFRLPQSDVQQARLAQEVRLGLHQHLCLGYQVCLGYREHLLAYRRTRRPEHCCNRDEPNPRLVPHQARDPG
jgi:hypothetical protein